MIGAGCVLGQLQSILVDGASKEEMVPIAFASWVFDKTQTKYSAGERELLGIILALRKFQYYLMGTHIDVYTDHKSLLSLHRDFADPYSRIQRWMFELATRNVTLHYVRGEDNIADAFSRLLDLDVTRSAIELELYDEVEHSADSAVIGAFAAFPSQVDENNATFVSATAEAEIVLDYDEALIAKRQREDSNFGPIIEYQATGSLPEDDERARKILLEVDNYVMFGENSILMRIEPEKKAEEGSRLTLCVPKAMRRTVLEQHHDYAFGGSHMGHLKVLERVRRHYYWPNLATDVINYVSTCHVCQSIKRPGVASSSVFEKMVTKPGETLSIDLVGILHQTDRGNKYVLSVIDTYSKFAYAIPINAKDPEIIARMLVERVFPHHMPKRIVSDQGTEFVNKVILCLCEIFHIKKIQTTAYHPNSNGFVERIHQFYKSALSAYADENKTNWDAYLPLLVMSYNNTLHSATGFTPFFLSTGREFRLPTDYVPEVAEDISLSVNQYAESMQRMLARAHADVKILSAKLEEKLQKSQEGKYQTEFEINDQVMLFIPATKPGTSSKFVRRWVGPFRVFKKDSAKVYQLADLDGRTVKNKVSVMRLKSYKDRKILGSKWLTAEYDDRLDIALTEETVVRDVIDKQLRELNEANDSDEVVEQYEKEFDIVDYFVPNQHEKEDDDELPPQKKPRSAVPDESDAMDVEVITVYDSGMNGAVGHEAYVDSQGLIRLKERISTTKNRSERTRKPPSSLSQFTQ
jgi:hypothetical protein